MQRRIVVYKDKEGTIFTTPEFNGDKNEFEYFKMKDTCVANWDEILENFRGVRTLNDFRLASIKSQMCYKNMLGDTEISSIVCIKEGDHFSCDEVYVVEDGDVRLMKRA